MAAIFRSRVSKVMSESAEQPMTHEAIARVAFELFERRGRVHGRDQEDWFTAQRILRDRRRSQNGR